MGIRDKILEKVIRSHPMASRFGEIQKITVDSDNGTALLTVLLHGESAPMEFKVYYSFEDDDSQTYVVVNKVLSEKIWINEAIEYWFESHTLRHPLPRLAGGIAKILF